LADGLDYEYVRDEVAARLLDRVLDINREFSDVLDFGCATGSIAKAYGGQGKFQTLQMVEESGEPYGALQA
jgi:NADH dehydrogenase [ubiquinone] 1 alpha subcomplex assembly factor 5